ncbi:hypothetical protein [Tellurirhabdus rosea]|uniref:hypothetical protein n=1 Tax=Tellurirhabdus rosea TaxID=2674997 RepID=UPI0022539E74|nr:hypothetical protein [Tellurirhabdus rosea]
MVCDTNIWYWLSAGNISELEIQNKHLIGTFVTAQEFCSTYNIINNYKLYREAVIAFNQRSSIVITETPIEYIKKLSGLDYSVNDGWEAFKALEYIIDNEILPSKELLLPHLDEYSNVGIELNSKVMALKLDIQSKVSERGAYRRAMTTESAKAKHFEVTKNIIAQLVGSNNINWEAIDLFISTFDEWLRQLSIMTTLTITPNDWSDIFNLVYVQPGDYYWSKDERKTKNFIKICGKSNYLI